MKHFKNISDMIDSIEAEAGRYMQSADTAVRGPRTGVIEFRATVANTRGYAQGLRETARMLRDTYIGAELHSAKSLEECR